MVDGVLDLVVHCLFHLSPGISSVAAKRDNHAEGEDDEYFHNMVHLVAVVNINDTHFNIIFDCVGAQNTDAFLWRIGESRTNSIEDTLSLDLTPVGLVVNDN